jgi:predicted amidohydrolase YtcJ
MADGPMSPIARFLSRHRLFWTRRLAPLALGSLLLTQTAVAQPADLVIQRAQVLTMDAAKPTASAVAIRDHRIVYVGDDAGLTALMGPHTRVIAAPGEISVLPGLTDAHAHLVGLGMSLQALDLRGLDSAAAIAKAVTQVAQAHPADKGWILGRGWDQNRFQPPRFPDRAALRALDEASAGHPVWLRRIDGHAGWASSAALSASGHPSQDRRGRWGPHPP